MKSIVYVGDSWVPIPRSTVSVTLLTLPGLVYRGFDRWKPRNISLLVAMGPLNSSAGDQRCMTLKAGSLVRLMTRNRCTYEC